MENAFAFYYRPALEMTKWLSAIARFFCIHSAADALVWEGFIILEKPFLGIERGFWNRLLLYFVHITSLQFWQKSKKRNVK